MKVFPAHMNSLMKTGPLVGSTELSTDDRAHQRLMVMAMRVEDTQLLLYPRLIPLVRKCLQRSDELKRDLKRLFLIPAQHGR